MMALWCDWPSAALSEYVLEYSAFMCGFKSSISTEDHYQNISDSLYKSELEILN